MTELVLIECCKVFIEFVLIYIVFRHCVTAPGVRKVLFSALRMPEMKIAETLVYKGRCAGNENSGRRAVCSLFLVFFMIFPFLQSNAAIYFARTSGNWNNPATWSTAAYGGAAAVSTPGSAPGDVVMLSGCQITVTASPSYPLALIAVSQNYNSGNNTRLLLNTAGITLTCNSLTMLDNNRNDHTEIEFTQAAVLQVNGNVSVTRSASNNRDKRVGLYIRNGGRMNVTGNFSFTYARATPNETRQNEIELNNGRLDIGGNFTVTAGNTNGNSNQFEFELDNNAVFNVGGKASVTLANTDDDDNIIFNLKDGVFSVAGSINATVAGSVDGSSCVAFNVSGAQVNAGSLTYASLSSNDANRPQFYFTGSGQLNISGDLLVTHGKSSWDATAFEWEMNDDAVVNVDGNATFSLENTNDGDDFTLDLNGGQFNVSGTSTVNVKNTSSGGCTFTLAIDGGTYSGSDMIINHNGGSGGDINIRLNENSTAKTSYFTLYNDFSFLHTAGDNLNFETYDNSVVNISGQMQLEIASSADGDVINLQLNGGTVALEEMECLISSGATSANDLNLLINGASVSIAGDLSITQSGGGGTGDISILLNQSSTARQSQLTIGGNLELAHSGGDNMEIELNNNAAFTIAGNATISHVSNDGDDMILDINGGTFSVLGDFDYSKTGSGSSYEDLDIRIDGSGRFTTNGSFTVNHASGGQVVIYLNTSSGNNAVFETGNDFYIDHSPSASGMYIQLDQSSQMNIGNNFKVDNNASGGDAFRLRMNNSAQLLVTNDFTLNLLSGSSALQDNVELDVNGGTVSVGGNLKLHAEDGRDAIMTVDGSSVVTVGDTIYLSQTGGNVVYLYSGNASGSPVINASSLYIYDTGGGQTRFRMWNSSVLNISGDITFNTTASGQCDIALYNTSRMRLGGNINRGNDPYRYGILSCATGAVVELNGSYIQLLAGNAGNGGDGLTYSNIELNNSFPYEPQFIMTAEEGNVTIPAGCNLTFNKGIVSSNSASFFNIANGATVSGTSDLSYVDGPVRKTGTQAFIFPVGDNGNYRPAAITAPSNATHHFTAQYIYTDPGATYSDASKDLSLDHISDCEYWLINRTNGGSNVTVTLSWDESSCGVTDLPALRVAQWDGTTWRNRGNASLTGDTVAGSVSSSVAISSFSVPHAAFTLASTNAGNPLPVELLNFNAKLIDDKVNVKWQTASERQNDHFELQRSSDGYTFATIANIRGKGESITLENYAFTDYQPLKGISYYRLKQVDINGEFTYSDTRKIIYKNSSGILLYPNPSPEGIISIRSESSLESVHIYNMQGACVYQKVFGLESTIQLNTNLSAGMYAVEIKSDAGMERQLLIVGN